MNEEDFHKRIKRFLPKREQGLVMAAFRESAIAAQQEPIYGMEFETRTHPGFIKVTAVKLYTTLMDDTETVRLDIVNHPLYPALERFVKSNPRSTTP